MWCNLGFYLHNVLIALDNNLTFKPKYQPSFPIQCNLVLLEMLCVCKHNPVPILNLGLWIRIGAPLNISPIADSHHYLFPMEFLSEVVVTTAPFL